MSPITVPGRAGNIQRGPTKLGRWLKVDTFEKVLALLQSAAKKILGVTPGRPSSLRFAATSWPGLNSSTPLGFDPMG